MKIVSLFVLFLWSSMSLAEDNLYFDFSLAIMAGDIEGYLQTPDGGMVGTSSDQRPSFDELGIEKLTEYNGLFSAVHGRNIYFFGLNVMRSSSDAVLEKTLVSQWQTFTAGTPVDVDVKLDWYRLGYLRQFGNPDFVLSYQLGFDVVGLQFSYELEDTSNPAAIKVDRSYNKAGYRVGGSVTYAISDSTKFQFSAFVPISIESAANITSVELMALFKPLPADITFFAGIAAQEIDYKDQQTYPNHLLAELDATLKIGVSFRAGKN